MSGLAHADWAPALLGAFAVLALLSASAAWRTRRALDRLGAAALGAGLWRDLTLCAALLAVLLALLGPQLGTRRVSLAAGGIDLVLLIDVSRSMDAADTPPSRLARARDAAGSVLRGLDPGDRAALAVFAGRGELLTPLTHDTGALLEMLPALDSEWMADRGSRLAAGVEAALAAFESDSLRPRIVLTLGDGERAQLVATALLETLARAQVRVVAGAIGSEGGTAIVGPAGPLRDWNGDTVVTRRETRGLEKFAQATGGAVLVADAWGVLDAAGLLAAARRDLSPGPGGTLERELPASRYAAPAALAFALLLCELLATGRSLRWPRARARAGAAIAALALIAAGAGAPLEELEARVEAAPDDARALIALGVARTEAGDAAEGARAFAAAAVRASAPEDIALASYDLGVALLELRDFAGARDAFFDVLAYAPDDRQAIFNLEWALRALAGEAPPPPEASRPANEPSSEAEADQDSQAEPEPEPAPPPSPTPEAEAEADPPSEGEPDPRPQALSPEEVARWLESVRDEPPPGPRSESPAARSGPQW